MSKRHHVRAGEHEHAPRARFQAINGSGLVDTAEPEDIFFRCVHCKFPAVCFTSPYSVCLNCDEQHHISEQVMDCPMCGRRMKVETPTQGEPT